MDCYIKSEWSYKAEGNKHVVVCDRKGICLRLLKYDPQSSRFSKSINLDDEGLDENNTNNHHSKNLDEIEFIRCVVLPLLNYCDACYVPKVVTLPAKFLKELGKRIIADRPQHRVHQPLNYLAPALLMQDYCFIPFTIQLNKLLEYGAEFDSDVLTVEIKLKNGFLEDSNNLNDPSICQFCKTQMYRVFKEKRYQACSFYCPLDLFSGDKKRMKKALYALFLNPQNNLRLFQNGELLYSQEIFEILFGNHHLEDEKTLLSSSDILKDLFSHLFQPDSCIQPESLVDLLFQSLLCPVVSDAATNIPAGNCCNGAYFKNMFCKVHCQEIDFEAPSSSEACLPSNSILGIIISQQKLDTSTWPDICKKSEALDYFLDKHAELNSELCVDAPYSSSGWKHFLDDPCNAKQNDKVNEMSKVSHQLRQFFVAKSFNDCSVMLSFQRIENVPDDWPKLLQCLQSEYPPSSRFNLTSDSAGNYYVFSIAIVDTDPKYPSNMSVYRKKYSEISVWWENMLKSLKLPQ